MKVFVYLRPRIDVFFTELAGRIEAFSEVHYVSDHRNLKGQWIGEYYYKAKKDVIDLGITPSTKLNVKNIKGRCRYLRQLSNEDAYLRINSMAIAAERMIEEYDVQYMFGMVMDSYVLDIFDLILRSKGGQYVGFLNNMINGYSRLTSRGELIHIGEENTSAAKEAYKDLSRKGYVPHMQNDFMWNTSPIAMFFTKYLKEKAKVVYYFLRKKYDRDPDNFYYNTVAHDSCMTCHKLEQLFYRGYEETDFDDIVASAKGQGKKIIYMPLQFYPECSIDYWGTVREFSQFYKVVEDILSNEYTRVLIITKEHPSASGLRKVPFYESFKSNSNVLLAPFDVSSNSLIEHADVVLTWTGSVGVETLVRGKPLVTLGEAYYDNGKLIKQLSSPDDLKNLEQIVLNYLSDFTVDQNEIVNLLNFTITGLIKGYIFPLDYGTDKNPKNENAMRELSINVSQAFIKLKQSGLYPTKTGCI